MNISKFVNRSDTAVDNAIKIQGTNYDRKRKVTKNMKHKMEQMYAAGKSYNYIANHFGVAYNTVRYNLDEEFKQSINRDRNNYARNWKPEPGILSDRANYKRDLARDKNFRRVVTINV